VRLHAAVPQPVLARVLASSHLFLCASRTAPDGDREGLPNALKEAMAVGLPVVATRHAGIPALCADGAGLLAPEGEVAALGEALTTLARRPESWGGMARRARARVEAFDLRRVVARLEAVYEEVRG
jgi:colanic acid/amylovoran biosynthesis glycosyltransferase